VSGTYLRRGEPERSASGFSPVVTARMSSNAPALTVCIRILLICCNISTRSGFEERRKNALRRR